MSSFITGKVTSLVAKRDVLLAARIEEAMRKNESLEALNKDNVRRDVARAQITEQKGKKEKLIKQSNQRNKAKAATVKSSSNLTKASSVNKSGKSSTLAKSAKGVKVVKTVRASSRTSLAGNKKTGSKKSTAVKSTASKLRVVPLRGRSSSSSKK